MTDYTGLSDEELATEHDAVVAEVNRRNQLVSVPQQIAELNSVYLSAEGTEQGEPWRQPTGAHDAYPLDWVASHSGSDWKSLVAGNVWEPGVSGWAVEGGGEWPVWVAPTGAHDAYAKGAKVAHAGKHWVSDLDGNVWTPGEYGWTEEV